MINIDLLKESKEMLLDILKDSQIPEKEKQYRKKELLNVYEKIIKDEKMSSRYYELAHEIKSIKFLECFPDFKTALDHKHESGADFKIFDKYNIECVCSSSGNEVENGLDKLEGTGTDYNKKEQIILTRLTGSIKAKRDFYYKHIDKGIIKRDEAYIIFISLGNLAYKAKIGVYGFDLNKILLGVGHLQIELDKNTLRPIRKRYAYNDSIIKHNNAEINCNIFKDKKYDCISAIIFTDAILDEYYTNKNTFLFINPIAKNKIFANRFKELVYWKSQNKGEKLYYFPRYKGINLNDKLSNQFF